MRPNYFFFMGYLKTWGGNGGSCEPLEPSMDPTLVIFTYLICIKVLFKGERERLYQGNILCFSTCIADNGVDFQHKLINIKDVILL